MFICLYIYIEYLYSNKAINKNDNVVAKQEEVATVFSSAVPPGSGAFHMPTRPSSSAASASTLRGEGPISEMLQ